MLFGTAFCAPSPWPGRYTPTMGSNGTRVAKLERQLAASKTVRSTAKAACARSDEARVRLERIIPQLRRDKFGSKREKASPDRQHFSFESAEGMLEAASEEVEKA